MHNSFTKATRHSDVWHEGVRAVSRLEIRENAPRPFVGGEFLLQEIFASPKCGAHGKNTIVFISDLHWSGLDRGMYKRLSEEISALEADFILFGGDLGVFADSIANALEWISTLSAKKGIFAVSGNRESCLNWLDADFWRKAYANVNARYLCNEIADMGDLVIYGADDFRFGAPDWSPLEGVDRSRPVISFTHNPDFAASA
ncbi:MAG: metallophosphoesterase, partial [Victivallales bacterium]|nr:metallophosphoesterase [Victivallales bacterium]